LKLSVSEPFRSVAGVAQAVMNEAGLMAQPAIAGLRPPHIAHRR